MSTLDGRVTGIVDAHAHFFNPRTPPWSLQRLGRSSVPVLRALPAPLLRLAGRFTDEHRLGDIAGPGALGRRYEIREYGRDLAGLGTVAGVSVESVIPVDSQWRRRSSPDDAAADIRRNTEYLAGLAYGNGMPALGGLVVPADDRLPDLGIRESLAHDEAGLIRGVRLRWGRHPDPLVYDWSDDAAVLDSANLGRTLPSLIERGLLLEVLCYSHQLGDLAVFASDYPELPIVVGALGLPVGVFGPVGSCTGTTAAARADIIGLWRERMAMLAARPNVSVKISGIANSLFGYGRERSGNIGGQHILADMIGPLVLHVVDRFGPERVLFGSNAPLDDHNATIDVTVGALLDVLADRGDHLLAHLFAENARRLYRIPEAGPKPGEPEPAGPEREEPGSAGPEGSGAEISGGVDTRNGDPEAGGEPGPDQESAGDALTGDRKI
ncbi:MAG: amidohydrolase family protein [Gordonia sp. (in: high G+C Gram-positive bacteria)]|uniref:amidohydrolase family protein n=1 Tax=Gordonia sp. (in: high G+C Gram-positive bacteria) TaxID=84139 RepID=UPI0039E52821